MARQPDFLDELIAKATPPGDETPSLEELFTGADYFGVTTATPLQRAVCRMADGVPMGDLAGDFTVQEAFSSWTDRGLVPNLSEIVYNPAEIIFLAATRCGKTRFAGSMALRISQTCDISDLKPGERARIPIVSLSIDLANEAFSQIAGTIKEQPKLRSLLVREPIAGVITLRHPSGKPIDIVIAAGRRAGGSLIARWFPCVIFDEAPRMMGSDSGAVVNLDDSLKSIASRMRGPILHIGSPWAPMGPIYKKVMENHGKPTQDLVVVRGKGPWLNPTWWNPERVDRLRKSEKPEDRFSYRTDCEADFADPEEGLFASGELSAVTRHAPPILPPQRGQFYVGAIDTATRSNAWTLVIRTRALRTVASADGPGRPMMVDVIVGCWQWQGSKDKPLDPDVVFKKIADILNPMDPLAPRYSVTRLASDQWSFDAMQSIARRHGINLLLHHLQGAGRTQAYLDAQVKVSMRQVEISPDDTFRSDLLSLRKRVTQNGMNIHEPQSANGRHADYAPAFVRVLQMACPDPVVYLGEAEEIEKRGLETDIRSAKAKRDAAKGKGDKWWQQDPTSMSTARGRGVPKPPY